MRKMSMDELLCMKQPSWSLLFVVKPQGRIPAWQSGFFLVIQKKSFKEAASLGAVVLVGAVLLCEFPTACVVFQ